MEKLNIKNISIIIPVYNRAELVAKCLDSILAQTSPNWDCIVVDDISTDNTWEVINNYAKKDQRISVYKRNREPKGAPTCRNIGMQKSVSDFIMFLDSDDLLAPWAVESRLKFINTKRNYDLYIFNGIDFDENGISQKKERRIFYNKPLDNLLKFSLSWSTPCAIWNKSFLESVGGWHEHSMSSQDDVLNLIAIYKGGTLCWGNELPDIFYRVEKGFDKISNTMDVKKIYNRIQTLNYLQTELQPKHFQTYSKFFLSDLINKIENLDKKSLNELLTKDFFKNPLIAQISNIRLYLSLYKITLGKIFFKGLIYRSRNILIKNKRLTKHRVQSKLNENSYNKLCEKLNKYKDFKYKINLE